MLRTLCLRDMCGVDVANVLGGQGLDMSEGSVYAILRGLERNDLVVGLWVDIGVGLPRRRYYRLTAKGKLAASRSIAQGPKLATPAPQIGGTWS